MKTLNYTILLLSILTLSFGATSCKKDKEDPTITVDSPAEHTDFKWGDEVHIMATFADDRELKSYSVMVGDEDGHHIDEINFMSSGDLSEMTYNFHAHFTVPDDAPMMAWLHFTVVDAENKTTTLKWMMHFEE